MKLFTDFVSVVCLYRWNHSYIARWKSSLTFHAWWRSNFSWALKSHLL